MVSQINDKEKNHAIRFLEDSFEFAPVRPLKPLDSAKDLRERKARERERLAQEKKNEALRKKQEAIDKQQEALNQRRAEREKPQPAPTIAEQPAPEPAAAVTPEPVAAITPEPVVAVAPEPVVSVIPEPVVATTPEPVVVATPEPVVAVTPEPTAIAAPVPVAEPTPEPVAIIAPEPVAETTPVAETVPTPATTIDKPRRTKKKSRPMTIFLNIIIVILSVLILYQIFMMAKYYLELRANENISNLAAEIARSATRDALLTPDSAPASPGPTYGTPKPAASSEPVVLPVVKALRAEFQNDDIIGYITIEGTNINYPVLQTTNNDFYISHNLMKENNAGGAVFMDQRNSPTATDRNTVLFAHNMKDGSMFHNLRYYSDKQFFLDHRTIIFSTLYEESVWEVFSFYPTETNFDYIRTDFSSGSPSFTSFLSDLQLRSVVKSNVEVTAEDTILTLSTCTNGADNMRYALHAKRVYPQT